MPAARLAVAGTVALFLALPTAPARAQATLEKIDGGSGDASISDDGRFVAFLSFASDLVPGDTNNSPDVFVRDRQAGTNERVNVNTRGVQANTAIAAEAPVISGNGRFVAFISSATNLVAGDTNGARDVFVRDRQTDRTERVSVGAGGVQADLGSTDVRPAISADGRFVGFVSEATNLVPGDTGFLGDVFVRDRQTGTTDRVSVGTGGAQANSPSLSVAVSANGRFVAFASTATNLVPNDTNRQWDVFVRDRQAGATQRVSVSTAGVAGNGRSRTAVISADGRFVAFTSEASNLVPGDANQAQDVFVRDRRAGTTERVSVATGGGEGSPFFGRGAPAISPGGRFVAFDSQAGGLVPGDFTGRYDVFVRDRLTGRTERASVSAAGVAANRPSFRPAISAGGRFVAFSSPATNLIPGDTSGEGGVFVRGR